VGCDVFCITGLADPVLVGVNESVIAYTNRGTAKFAVLMIPAAGWAMAGVPCVTLTRPNPWQRNMVSPN
jgi:hypothetical protein